MTHDGDGPPISLENCYKFLVLLPLEADEKVEVLEHYFGITTNNEFIARVQGELLYTLFDCKDSAEVLSKGYARIRSATCYKDNKQKS
ncbi:MAG: hypothetical protein WAK17_12235 [Candidatus Nitrosopolaris sp.]